jgi:hypothetical protein
VESKAANHDLTSATTGVTQVAPAQRRWLDVVRVQVWFIHSGSNASLLATIAPFSITSRSLSYDMVGAVRVSFLKSCRSIPSALNALSLRGEKRNIKERAGSNTSTATWMASLILAQDERWRRA